MKYFILTVALLGVSSWAETPCNEDCLANCPKDSRCPASDLEKATLLRHLSDCTKFIKCDSGHGCVQDCPPGLHFNENEKICDWPSSSCCDPTVTCGPPTTETPLLTCVPNPECPANNPLQPVLLAHQLHCSKFLKCHNGNACEYDCPAGLHFNLKEKTCDWPWRACCDPSIPCDPCPTCTPPTDVTTTPATPMPTTTPTPTTTPVPITTTTPLPTTNPVPTPMPTPNPTPGDCPTCQQNCDLDPRCPAKNQAKAILLPSLTSCSEFFKCETGRACRMMCPTGLHFNQKTEVCDWPWNACCDPSVACVKPCIPGVTCAPTVG